MNTCTMMYISELEEIVRCDQSESYLKKWAEEKVEELNSLRHQPKPLSYYVKPTKSH